MNGRKWDLYQVDLLVSYLYNVQMYHTADRPPLQLHSPCSASGAYERLRTYRKMRQEQAASKQVEVLMLDQSLELLKRYSSTTSKQIIISCIFRSALPFQYQYCNGQHDFIQNKKSLAITIVACSHSFSLCNLRHKRRRIMLGNKRHWKTNVSCEWRNAKFT